MKKYTAVFLGITSFLVILSIALEVNYFTKMVERNKEPLGSG